MYTLIFHPLSSNGRWLEPLQLKSSDIDKLRTQAQSWGSTYKRFSWRIINASTLAVLETN